MDALVFQCCFCGDSIHPVHNDPVSVIIPLQLNGSQNLWTHEKCLRQQLHESVPLAIDEPDN